MSYRPFRKGEIEHTGFFGITQSGKSTLARAEAFRLTKEGRLVMVFAPPMGEPPWPCRWQTAKVEEFLRAFWDRRNRGAAWFIEEAATDFFGASPDEDRERVKVFTRGRHSLQRVYAITQEYRGISGALPPSVRNQLTRVFCCNQGHRSVEALVEEKADEGFRAAKGLPKGRFVYKATNNDPAEIRAFDLAAYRQRFPEFGRHV